MAFGSASTTSPSNSTFSSLGKSYMTLTFVACGPLAPSPSSYSTLAPSASVRKPSPMIAEKWTNASFPPSSGVMKPKPFSSLNHFTTPVAIRQHSSLNPACARVSLSTAFPHTYSHHRLQGGPDGASCTSPRGGCQPSFPGSGAWVPPVPGEPCGWVSYCADRR